MLHKLKATAICVFASMLVAQCGEQLPQESTTTEQSPPTILSPNPAAYSIGPLLYADTFQNLTHWRLEIEPPGTPATIVTHDNLLDVSVPRGCTLWLMQPFDGPVLITYQAQMIRANPPGPNDRVSDLNCFWMATDSRAKSAEPADFFNIPERNGVFKSYDQLNTYYVGQGGNTNSTTRFRRYIGQTDNRPLRDEDNLTAKETLLTPNQWQTLTLVAAGNLIEYYRDNTRLFQLNDPAPYTHGYFAIRTTQNHMQVRNLKIYRLQLKK